MQWAGIRRELWTNNDGDWEVGKVRDLVDALGLKEGNTDMPDDSNASMFVTKHEILILSQQMGDNLGWKPRLRKAGQS
jgi:hypothetical protein